jgi:hypothetical protein
MTLCDDSSLSSSSSEEELRITGPATPPWWLQEPLPLEVLHIPSLHLVIARVSLQLTISGEGIPAVTAIRIMIEAIN